jgi:branched-subunit amino acid transport protein
MSLSLPWPEFWLLTAALAVVVTGSRLVFLYVPQAWHPRGGLERALRYAPLAALVALTVPHALEPLLLPEATFETVLADARLPAAAVLLAVAAATRSPFAGLLAGLLVFVIV